MKKLLFASLFLVVISSCKEKEDKDDKNEKKSDVMLPLDVMYKGTPSIGKTENMVTVMNWNNNMIKGDVTAAGSLIADSLTVNLADGMHVDLAHDSAIAFLNGWRSSMDSAKQTYNAIIPVDNKTAGDEWVIQWTHETYYYKNGKTEDVRLNESYRLVNGKIRQVNQYAQAIPAKK